MQHQSHPGMPTVAGIGTSSAHLLLRALSLQRGLRAPQRGRVALQRRAQLGRRPVALRELRPQLPLAPLLRLRGLPNGMRKPQRLVGLSCIPASAPDACMVDSVVDRRAQQVCWVRACNLQLPVRSFLRC